MRLRVRHPVGNPTGVCVGLATACPGARTARKKMPSHNSNFNSPPEKPFYVSETEQLFGDISCHAWSWPWPPSCASRRVAAALSRGAESQPGGFTSPWTLAGVPWINYLFYCSEGRRVFLKHSIPNTRVNSDPSESDTRQASPLQHPRASTS